jgi:hypothetical protein
VGHPAAGCHRGGLLDNLRAATAAARAAGVVPFVVPHARDATAAFGPAMMHAAHELNGPTVAHAIVTTDELLAALPQMS